MTRRARIVATLGPSSKDEATIRALILAGLDVARLNFSHGTHADHAERIALLRRLSTELGRHVAILQDLQGPKLRVGTLPEGGIQLSAGQRVALTPVETEAKAKPGVTVIPMDVPNLAHSVQPGNRILLDDGHLEMQVTGVNGDSV